MRKIKNFKVNLRVKEISRVIKKLIGAVEPSVELEKTIRQCCRFYVKFLVPSAIYETFSKETLPFAYEKGAPPKWVAKSVFFVTICDNLYDEYKKNKSVFGEHTCKIVSEIAIDALDQSKNFAQRLISNEASEENCEISRVVDIPSNLYSEFSKVVPIDKIGISIESEDIIPKYSTCGLFYWIPSNKKRKK
ncbi:hypothetical protein AGMMS49990_07440 [Endomicrobiia bacterium]|nr:hypothetical protein AGMMS49990_07440 [Endomicrobiia bacterium]